MRLRQTWEHTVEAGVLNGTVMRFRVSIETNRLKKIALTEAVKRRVERGIEGTSHWAHHRAPALHLAPRTPDQLKEMADDLRDLHAILDGKPPLRALPDAAA
jgi:hypothetical protein